MKNFEFKVVEKVESIDAPKVSWGGIAVVVVIGGVFTVGFAALT